MIFKDLIHLTFAISLGLIKIFQTCFTQTVLLENYTIPYNISGIVLGHFYPVKKKDSTFFLRNHSPLSVFGGARDSLSILRRSIETVSSFSNSDFNLNHIRTAVVGESKQNEYQNNISNQRNHSDTMSHGAGLMFQNLYYKFSSNTSSFAERPVFIILKNKNLISFLSHVDLQALICVPNIVSHFSEDFCTQRSNFLCSSQIGMFVPMAYPYSMFFPVNVSDTLSVVLINCSSNKHSVRVSGKIFWKNSFGYLSAINLSKFNSYAFACCFYFFLFMISLVTYFRHYVFAPHIYLGLTFLIFLFLVSSIFSYMNYLYNNYSPDPQYKLELWTTLFQSSLPTFFYMFILFALRRNDVNSFSLKYHKYFTFLFFFGLLIASDFLRSWFTYHQWMTFSPMLYTFLHLHVCLLHFIVFFFIFKSYKSAQKMTHTSHQSKMLSSFILAQFFLLLLALFLFMSRICYSQLVFVEKRRYEYILYDLAPLVLWSCSLLVLLYYRFLFASLGFQDSSGTSSGALKQSSPVDRSLELSCLP